MLRSSPLITVPQLTSQTDRIDLYFNIPLLLLAATHHSHYSDETHHSLFYRFSNQKYQPTAKRTHGNCSQGQSGCYAFKGTGLVVGIEEMVFDVA